MDKNKFPKVMLDSGAYTAKSKGITIDIDSYADFVRKYNHFFFHQLNLDVIGKASASYHNWKYLWDKGVETIPVFHVGSDPKWLERYLKFTDYIAIGAIANMDTVARRKGLDWIWNEYLAPKGYVRYKVHGLGLTTPKILQEYPWYSVDSFTPIISAVWGSILLPRLSKDNKELDYTNFSICKISDQGVHTAGTESSFLSLPKGGIMKEMYEHEFTKAGFILGNPYYQKIRPRRSPKRSNLAKDPIEPLVDLTQEGINDPHSLSGSWIERMRWNLRVWDTMVTQLRPNKYHIGEGTLEAPPIVFVGVSGTTHCRVIGEAGDFDLLVSYAYYNSEKALSVIKEYKEQKTR